MCRVDVCLETVVQKQPPKELYGKGVLTIFAKFTGKTLYRSLCFE